MLAQHRADDDGESVGRHHAYRRPDPDADPVVVGRKGDGGEHGLVAEFCQEEGRGDGDEGGSRDATGLVLLVVGEIVTAQGPEAEDQESDTADDGNRRGGEGDAQVVADGDRDEVNKGGGDGDSAEDDPPAIAQGKRHCHQLRLVTEFCDKNDAETQKYCGKQDLLLRSV